MNRFKGIALTFSLVCVVVWLAGCAGCNPPPLPSGMTPTSGPETGGTLVKITGEDFDIKNGVIVTFDGKSAQNINVPSETQVTCEAPAGTAGQEAAVKISNKGQPEDKREQVTVPQKFAYTDATPPEVTTTDPSGNETISEYEDSMQVMNSLSITFNEAVNAGTGSVFVTSGTSEISGKATGSGNTITFTADEYMTAGNVYSITVSSIEDTAGNALTTPYKFSFTIQAPDKVKFYKVRPGDTLPAIASRPEVYGNSDREYQLRLVEANQDYYDFNPNRLFVGQQLIVPRGKAWGDEVAAE